ncbi:MAG: AEC family transporter [Armatimonadota bacterium]|nr:AEC family transporter [Armatimonadota bacterium]MDR7439958.1 AEC family transporter [Armatimonadota bacterium]MDR7562377.1 AEC family transporter [Armatimonadota bacterium]MDR7601541.1 AEC family transporter [Armatimonadota bacterium]
MLLFHVMLPVALLTGLGAWLGRRRPVDVRSLSTVSIYLFSPALVFDSLLRSSSLAAHAFPLVLTVVFHLLGLLLGGLAAARFLKLGRPQTGAFLLPVVMYNAGNYGLPLNFLAFGEEGLRLALVVFVTMGTVGTLLGSLVAAWGADGEVRRALRSVLELPVVYAATAALLALLLHWAPPEPIQRAVRLLAAGAIPLLLVTLGIQLVQPRTLRWSRPLGLAVLLRLVASPLLAAGLAHAVGLEGLVRRVAILQAAMPSAVNAFLYASEFRCDPGFVAGTVVATTLGSFATVTVLLALLT